MRKQAVITSTGSEMIPGTGWSWADAVGATREHARESRLFPNPTERVLAARFHEFGDGIEFLDAEADERNLEGIDLDEVLEHLREARQLERTHRSPMQRVAHRHGECSCCRRQ